MARRLSLSQCHCSLQGLAQSDDPEPPTEASPVLIHEIPINSNNQPEMMVSSSIPTASPSPLPERCAPHRIFGISWSPDRVHMAVGINSGTNDCGYSGAELQESGTSGHELQDTHKLIYGCPEVGNSNNQPEMMVSSSIPTASPSPLPERCAPHRIFGISWSPDRVHMAVGINSGTNDCGYSGAELQDTHKLIYGCPEVVALGICRCALYSDKWTAVRQQ